jgi:hypothetical protein
MQSSLLRQLTKDFSKNRIAIGKAIRQVHEADPAGFATAAAEVLRETANSAAGSGDGAGQKYLLAILLAEAEDSVRLLCNPEYFSATQSIGLLQVARTLDPAVDVRLAKTLTSEVESDEQAKYTTRVLEVLAKAPDPSTILPALRQLLQSGNGRVRSKAALLIGRIIRNPQWALHSDPQGDDRVMANAIESIWGLDTPAAKQAFRMAARERRNRAAGNAAFGLYIAGEMESVGLIRNLCQHESGRFRTTGAWVMGRTGDPRFLPWLAKLLKDSDPNVRRVAFKSTADIRGRVKKLSEAPAIQVQIRSAVWREGEHTIDLVLNGGAPSAGKLDARHFVVWNGHEQVAEYTAEEYANPAPPHWMIRFEGERSSTHLVKVEVFTDSATGEDTGFELAM